MNLEALVSAISIFGIIVVFIVGFVTITIWTFPAIGKFLRKPRYTKHKVVWFSTTQEYGIRRMKYSFVATSYEFYTVSSPHRWHPLVWTCKTPKLSIINEAIVHLEKQLIAERQKKDKVDNGLVIDTLDKL